MISDRCSCVCVVGRLCMPAAEVAHTEAEMGKGGILGT